MGTEGEGKPALGVRAAELATAAVFFVLGALVVYDSLRLGAGWAEDGPQAGYFPFYIGALICGASVVNFVLAIAAAGRGDRTFVETGQLKLVMAVLLPTIVYTVAIGWIGIYVASAIFVAYFMRRLGQYAWWKVATVSLGNSVFFFLVFEVWFKIPLPKGPLEAWLRLN